MALKVKLNSNLRSVYKWSCSKELFKYNVKNLLIRWKEEILDMLNYFISIFMRYSPKISKSKCLFKYGISYSRSLPWYRYILSYLLHGLLNFIQTNSKNAIDLRKFVKYCRVVKLVLLKSLFVRFLCFAKNIFTILIPP